MVTSLVDSSTQAPAAGVDSLLSGSQWLDADASGKTVISYSFCTEASQFAGEAATFGATLSAFSAADQAMTRALLDSIAAVCNVRFVEVADTGTQCGQLRYGYSQEPNNMGYAGYAFFPSDLVVGGDSATARSRTGCRA